MRSFFLPLLVLSVLAAAFAASAQSDQAPTNSTLPAKAKKGAKATDSKTSETPPSNPEEAKHDYSTEAFVVEQYRSIYRFENDGTGRKETVARVRVQSEAGVQQWGQIQVGYNSANERVEMDYVRVIKADGKAVKAGEDAVQDLRAPLEQQAPVYTDYRQKHITVPGLRPGEVLEYHIVTVIHTALAPGQFWADYEFDKNNITLDEVEEQTWHGSEDLGRAGTPPLPLDQFAPGARRRSERQRKGQRQKQKEASRRRTA